VRLKWGKEKIAMYDANLVALGNIAARNRNALNPNAREMRRLALMIVDRWNDKHLTPSNVSSGGK
jgi:hypothetical protein